MAANLALTSYLHALLDRAKEYVDPAPEVAIIAPGAEVAWDNCCGQLWVRVVDFGPPSGVRQTRKADGSLCAMRRQAQIEVGMLRCAAVVNDQGQPPTEQELNEDGAQVLADAEGLWALLSCEVKVREVLRWTPVGPAGGCVGGHWRFTIDLED